MEAGLMTDRYAVIGQPIAHSKSPRIHAAFAAQTGQDLRYDAVLGDLERFEVQVAELARGGLRGMNVTLPFKERALALADRATARARDAGAANTLAFGADGILADNTDGVGLLRDLAQRQRLKLAGMRVLVLGAGGAVRGIVGPLLAARPSGLHLYNRTLERARGLVADFSAHPGGDALAALDFAQLALQRPYQLIVNATSASLSGAIPDLPAGLFHPAGAVCDLAYRTDGDTPFLAQARAAGVGQCADGLGMLVEQAAEAFLLWRGVRPDTEPVLRELRPAEPR
jgi:shikimate dehydrogenase